MDNGTPITILYTNHRGETALRRISPVAVVFGASEWHPEEQWLLIARDIDRGDRRHFAMRDIHGWHYEDGGVTPEERATKVWQEQETADDQDAETAIIAAAIREAVAEEREACALLAYEYPAPDPGGSWRESIGAAIRARKEP